jgi:hypothetical protein
VLAATTLHLWIGDHDFPQVPAFERWAGFQTGLRSVAFLVFAFGGIVSLFTPRPRRAWCCAAFAWVVLVCCDQHCNQVWAYHLLLCGLIATCARTSAVGLERLRWLTIGIYAWSAVSKLDAGFVAGPGRVLWSGLVTAFHLSAGAMSPPFANIVPWMMPAGELLTAILLGIPKWRRMGLILSLVMHGLLLLAVGPLGLQHEAGVQLWNAVFIGQNLLLFGKTAGTGGVIVVRKSQFAAGAILAERMSVTLLMLAVTLPVLQAWNLWDVWPSWAVYSTRGGWTTIFVHDEDVEKLPEAAREFVGAAPILSEWRPVDIDAWSLKTLHCPVYPQARFRIGVAAALSAEARIRVDRRSPPGRFSGESKSDSFEFTGGRLPEEVTRQFWLNSSAISAARR